MSVPGDSRGGRLRTWHRPAGARRTQQLLEQLLTMGHRAVTGRLASCPAGHALRKLHSEQDRSCCHSLSDMSSPQTRSEGVLHGTVCQQWRLQARWATAWSEAMHGMAVQTHTGAIVQAPF